MNVTPIRKVVLRTDGDGIPSVIWESTRAPVSGLRLLTISPVRPGHQLTGVVVFDSSELEHVFVLAERED